MAPAETLGYNEPMRKWPLNFHLTALALAGAGAVALFHPPQVGDSAPLSPSQTKKRLPDLSLLKMTLFKVQESYVDPTRIQPKKMLFAALDSVQYQIPEILAEPDEQRDQLTVVVNNKRRTFSTKDIDSPWRLLREMKKIFFFIEGNIEADTKIEEVEYAAINGLLHTLDPHSLLLDPKTAKDMDVKTSGHFGGLGILIRIIKGKLTIIRPLKGTPAERAGLKRGDHIWKINDELTENLTSDEAVERMRGKPNTKLHLWIKRKGIKKPFKVPLTRARILLETVTSELIDGSVGYIRIEQFSGQTTKEVKDAMTTLKSQGAQGWVLDLRHNPGGLLDQAIGVANLFIDKGTLVTTVERSRRRDRRADRNGTDTRLPLVALINGNSASASEIVAGALKNLNRGIVLGTTSFGKGSVQVLYDFDGGSKLKLTIAEYLTPGDRSIQSVGVTPDIMTHRMFVPKQNKSEKDYLRLEKFSNPYQEKDLEASLRSKYQQNKEKPAHDVRYVYERPKRQDPLGEEIKEEDLLGDEFVEDFEIRLAKKLVTQIQAADRKTFLTKASPILKNVAQAEEQKTKDALQKLGVDWTPVAVPNAPSLSAKVTIDKGPRVKAGDVIRLKGSVTNTSNVVASQVRMRSKSSNGFFDERELVFGAIPPGKTRTWDLIIKVPIDMEDREDDITFTLSDVNGERPEVRIAHLPIAIAAAPRPSFSYKHQLIDTGNGNGYVELGESMKLLVRVKNTGSGPAKETTAVLRNKSGYGVSIRKARYELKELAPGEERKLEFLMDITPNLSNEELVLEMFVYDSELHESVSETLRYPVKTAPPALKKKRGTVILRTEANLHQSPASESGVIAAAPKGTKLSLLGEVNGWSKVRINKERPAFVPNNVVQRSSGSPSPISPRWQVTPPKLTVETKSLTTSQKTYRLKGTVQDSEQVKDLYIYVSNRDAKIRNRKVYYQSNAGRQNRKSLTFDSHVKLWPGSNRIIVVARENKDVVSTETLFIQRK